MMALWSILRRLLTSPSLCSLQDGVGGDHRAANERAHVRQSDHRRVRLGSTTRSSRVSAIPLLIGEEGTVKTGRAPVMTRGTIDYPITPFQLNSLNPRPRKKKTK